jgi:Domain of unknown function (DUF1905)
MKINTHTFNEKVWLYPGEMGNWHFVTLPKSTGKEIKETFGKSARGFGSLPVSVTIGATTWKTSLFPDKYSGSYLLPIKASVRKKEDVFVGERVSCSIVLL